MRSDRRALRRFCVLAALLCATSGASAQSVRGHVERASGGPASYAIVALSQNGQEKARAITDADGNFYIRQVAPGKYDVVVMSRAGNTTQVANVPSSGATLNLRTR
jgi:hypothetical protein